MHPTVRSSVFFVGRRKQIKGICSKFWLPVVRWPYARAYTVLTGNPALVLLPSDGDNEIQMYV